MPITILFLSSAEISLPLLGALLKDKSFEVVGLVCQPDKPAGRDKIMKAPAPKLFAERHGLEVFQPVKLRDDTELLNRFSENPPDIILTFAYGQILPKSFLDLALPLNVHTSLLPKYRGASPIHSAILNGDKVSGFSLMKMVQKMDEGPVYHIEKFDLNEHITTGILHDGLADLAAKSVPELLIKIHNSEVEAVEQKHAEASYCSKISKDDGFLDFSDSAEMVFRKFHAYSPWPGLWTTFDSKRLKLLDIALSDKKLKAGEVLFEADKLFVGTSKGSIELLQMQLEGKQCMHPKSFILGQKEFSSGLLPS
ncbi:methionyl-tRNA formyltransferase [Candidatus Peregrinibacteria bacterium]|jgi:methionyl-tRNA formyltransferase|nr:methionyl-tRNA formyltransferase [Candidatus Peregrinibacteria bacterium]MBT4631895.1 methionyl-tRNA formyltransferase [Candidatus Peregrinibacteria bacterium]MBT5516559.1 methionyl-tRNA formyltransferase [Candidatus Peregrinibacteria bacterium]MBT5824184.1 methionyl-tRNA formyltransferase [Candidatus Peregrinibacteria bacterium]